MRIASILSLLYFCVCCVWITILLRFGLPQPHIIRGPDISYVPLVVSALLLLSGVFSIFLGRRVNPPPLKNPSFFRWVLFFIGVLILFGGFVVFSVSLYSPYLFGSEHSVPEIGVISWLIVSLILSLILYVVSRMNSSQRPNLFKYIVLVIAFVAASLTTVEALILIYAVPVQPPTAFSFLCALMTIAFIPYALLLSGLTKDYISIKKTARNLNKIEIAT